MRCISDTDFLRVLKSGALKSDSTEFQQRSNLNFVDFSMQNCKNNFMNDEYYQFLVGNRTDILKVEYPILHLLNHCLKEPKLQNVYFRIKEKKLLQDLRLEFDFFGPLEDFKNIVNAPATRLHLNKQESNGYIKNVLLSLYFSRYFHELYSDESNQFTKDFIEFFRETEINLNSFVNIEINDINVDFYSKQTVQDFLLSLNVLFCFDFRFQDNKDRDRKLTPKILSHYFNNSYSSSKPLLVLFNDFEHFDYREFKSKNNHFVLLHQLTESSLFLPGYISKFEILGEHPNKFYSTTFQQIDFFYIGDNYEFLFELNEVILNTIRASTLSQEGTLIFVEQLNVAGTEIISKSFNDFLHLINLPSMILFERFGELVETIDVDESYYLQVPPSRFGLRYILENLYNLGFKNIISFTAVNVSVIELAEVIGFKSFIFLNENLEDLKKIGIDKKLFTDEHFASRQVVVNSKSIFRSKHDYILEIPTSIPGSQPKVSEKKYSYFTKESLGVKGKILVGTLASGVFRKGLDRLQLILDNLPDNMVYLWVGGCDPKYLPASNNFIQINFMPQDNFFSLVDIYSCLSRNDPFPMSVTEAVLNKIPVIAYGAQSCGQIALGDFEDILVSDEDAKAFVQNLHKITEQKAINVNFDSKSLSLRLKYSAMAFNKKSLEMLNLNPPSISVILPYYNHEQFIYKRLESIIDQQIPIKEIIALDNNSTDNGFDMVTDLLKNQDVFDFRILRNEINNGNVFKQWYKGVTNSTSDYIWITETDDYANGNFLSELLPMLNKPDVVIATSNSKLVNEKNEILSLSNSVFEGIKNIHRFKSSYVNDGLVEIYEAIGTYNSIPNVSACLFRRKDLLLALDTLGDTLFDFKYAGDWLVYVQLLTQGSIAYNPNSLNYFRQHQKSNIKVANKHDLLDEISKVQKFAKSRINNDDSFTLSQKLYLDKVRQHLNLF